MNRRVRRGVLSATTSLSLLFLAFYLALAMDRGAGRLFGPGCRLIRSVDEFFGPCGTLLIISTSAAIGLVTGILFLRRYVPRVGLCLRGFAAVGSLLVGVFLLWELALLVEASCSLLVNLDASESPQVQSRPWIRVDSQELGKWNKPNATTHVRECYKGRKVFDVECHTDAFGCRVVPVDGQDTRPRFAVFFGCSVTWGTGCNDDETLPYYLGKEVPAYRPYAVACVGWGTQQVLAYQQFHYLRDMVKESEGIGIYVFITDHPRRVIGARTCASWTASYPSYRLSNQGNLEYLGSFAQGRPLRTSILSWLGKSNALNHFKVQLPPVNDRALDLCAAIILEAKHKFETTFPGSEFRVLVYPELDNRLGEAMDEKLARNGVDCITLPELYLANGKESRKALYPCFHPRPARHEKVAKGLVDALELNSPPSLPKSASGSAEAVE